MDKKTNIFSKTAAKFRGWIQLAAALLTNIHLPNLFKGTIYRGSMKSVCVPGLNCYSCPAASGACPIGAFQAVVGSSKFKFSYYITGFLYLSVCSLADLSAVFSAHSDGFRSFCIKYREKSSPRQSLSLCAISSI